LNASGQRTFRAYSAARPWLALGAGAQGLAMLGSIAVRASVSGVHPLQRDGFRFLGPECQMRQCDEPPFHRVAPLVWSAGLGAGVSFQ
jgi:hypothetical protein